MNGYIVVESEADGKLLGQLIPKDLSDKATIVVSNGKSAAVSLCRSILSQRQAPTALVVDSDTTDEAEIREQYVILNDLLRPVAGMAPYLVQLAVPEIEVILFSDLHALEKIIGVKPDDADIITAKYKPKEALLRLMKKGGISSELQLISHLDAKATAGFLQHPLVTNIIEFLRETLGQANVPPNKKTQRTANHAEHIQ